MARRPYNSNGCSTPSCANEAYCRALCKNCYRRWHYESHERARRGNKKTPRIPIGGKHKNSRTGYVHVKIGYRKFALEHRLVMERLIGRSLREDETIHHKNGVRDDNRPENLELWSSVHPKGQRVEDLVEFARFILTTYVSPVD